MKYRDIIYELEGLCMKCVKCGEEYDKEFVFCPNCGTKILTETEMNSTENESEVCLDEMKSEDAANVEKTALRPLALHQEEGNIYHEEMMKDTVKKTFLKKCREKRKWIVCFGAVFVLVIFTVTVLIAVNTDISKFSRHLKNEELEKASALYSECKEEDKAEIKDIVDKYCDELLQKYNNGCIGFEDGKNKITKAEEIVSSQTFINKITEMKNSKDAFEKGEKYEKSSNWAGAKGEYNKVITEDSNYHKAAEAIQKCDTEISAQAFEAGQTYETEGKWVDALVEYEKVTDTSSSAYKEIEDRKKVCIDGMKTNINKQLDELFAGQKYEEGLALIKNAEKYLSGDETLKAYKENFERKKEEAEKIKEQQKYDTGITYDQLARYPDEYKGKFVKFYGKVLQVQESSGIVVYRIGTSGGYYSDNVIYVMGNKVDTGGRILEDDYITVRGRSTGLYTYKSVLGASITIPSVYIEHIDK